MHALAALCVKRPVFATMLIVALMVVGVFSFFTLGVDLFPKIDLPTIIVTVANPGASAEEIESDITKRIEDAVNTTSGIDTMSSTSIEGNSTVVINFTLDKSGDVAAQEVRDKVNQVVPQLPETAKAPVVQKIDPGCAAYIADGGFFAAAVARGHRNRRQADQAAARKHFGRGRDYHRRRTEARDPRLGGSGKDARL